MGSKTYLATQDYQDSEVLALVSTASEVTGTPAGALLKRFGEFIVPDLMARCHRQVKPDWKTLDLLEHIEDTMHAVVRLREPGAAPPKLRCIRKNPGEVLIVYFSPRKLCALGEGLRLSLGIAKHFQERIAITHAKCMMTRAPACEIAIRLVKPV